MTKYVTLFIMFLWKFELKKSYFCDIIFINNR